MSAKPPVILLTKEATRPSSQAFPFPGDVRLHSHLLCRGFARIAGSYRALFAP
jgi:hypothetical protein